MPTKSTRSRSRRTQRVTAAYEATPKAKDCGGSCGGTCGCGCSKGTLPVPVVTREALATEARDCMSGADKLIRMTSEKIAYGENIDSIRTWLKSSGCDDRQAYLIYTAGQLLQNAGVEHMTQLVGDGEHDGANAAFEATPSDAPFPQHGNATHEQILAVGADAVRAIRNTAPVTNVQEGRHDPHRRTVYVTTTDGRSYRVEVGLFETGEPARAMGVWDDQGGYWIWGGNVPSEWEGSFLRPKASEEQTMTDRTLYKFSAHVGPSVVHRVVGDLKDRGIDAYAGTEKVYGGIYAANGEEVERQLQGIHPRYQWRVYQSQSGRVHEDVSGLDRFTHAYIQAALWTSMDDAGEPLEALHSSSDLAPATLEAMTRDTRAFQRDNAELLAQAYAHVHPGVSPHASTMRYDVSRAGHDFWLSRNGSGAGFFDRELPGSVGDALQKAAKAFGPFELYLGDDRKIYAAGHEQRANEDRLTTSQRRALPSNAFALPHRRALPIENAEHVRAAAARLSMMKHEGHVTPAEYEEARHRIIMAGNRFGVFVNEGATEEAARYVTKVGRHGTLHRYRIIYTDDDPGFGQMDWYTWAYNVEDAEEKFHAGDEGFKIVDVSRVLESDARRADESASESLRWRVVTPDRHWIARTRFIDADIYHFGQGDLYETRVGDGVDEDRTEHRSLEAAKARAEALNENARRNKERGSRGVIYGANEIPNGRIIASKNDDHIHVDVRGPGSYPVAREASRVPDGRLVVTKKGDKVTADIRGFGVREERGLVWAQRPDGIHWANGIGGTYYLLPQPSGEYDVVWMERGGNQRNLGTYEFASAVQVANRFDPSQPAQRAAESVASEHKWIRVSVDSPKNAKVLKNYLETHRDVTATRPHLESSDVDTNASRSQITSAIDYLGITGRIASEAGVAREHTWQQQAGVAPNGLRSVVPIEEVSPGKFSSVTIENKVPTVCGPWVKMERDVPRFEACMKLAEKIGPITGHDTLHAFIRPQMEREDVEVYYAVILDTQMMARGYTEIARGSRDSVMTPVQDTARFALHYAQHYGAQGLAVAHCHPSGKSRPSKADHDVTAAVKDMCRANNICFLDHIVCGARGEYYSFRAKKIFKARLVRG